MGSWILVGYGSFGFWLEDIQYSKEPNLYFGRIKDEIPENDADLRKGMVIGLNRWHASLVPL